MDGVSLVAIHGRERVRAGLLLALLGQLHQLGQLVVNHLHKGRLLLVESADELGVIGRELWIRDEVWILDFEGDVETAIALERCAVVVALQDLRGRLRWLVVDVFELNLLAILHLHCQLRALKLSVLVCHVLASLHFFYVSASTSHFDLLAAGTVRAGALVTREVAVVSALLLGCARLLTDVGC